MRIPHATVALLLVLFTPWALLSGGCKREDEGTKGEAAPPAGQPTTAATTAGPGAGRPELVLPDMDLGNLPMAVQTRIGDARYKARQSPGDVNEVGELGALCYVYKLPRAAIACFKHNTQLEPERLVWWYYLGLAYERAGESAQALAAYEKAAKIKGYEPVRARLAALGGASGKPAEGPTTQPSPAGAATASAPVDPLGDNLRLRGLDVDAMVNAAQGAAQAGQFAAAEKLAREAVRIDDANVRAQTELARVYGMQGKLDDAVRELKRVLSMAEGQESLEAKVTLANLYALRKQHEQAEPLLREAVQQAPQAPDIANSLAWVLATHPDPNLRKPEEAVKLAEKACELTGYKNDTLLDTLSVAYAAAGRFEDAKKQIIEALRLAKEANQTSAVKSYEERLKLYEAGKAYYETR